MPRAADMLGYRTGSQFGAGQTVDRSIPMATPTGEFIPTPPTASQEAWQGALSNPSVANILYGAGEATASLLSSPLPYVAGMVGYGYGALTGKDPKETGAQFQQATTLEPKTALGQYYTEQVGDKLSALPPVISGIPTPRLGAGATRYAGQQYGMPMLEKSMTMYEQGKLTPGFTPISQLEAWHGTPHEIKGNFDLAKVGTGEGAQSYGHGMYFGGARETGEKYALDLANRDISNQNRLNPHANAQRLVKLAGDPKYAADDIKFVLETSPDHAQKELLSATLKMIETGDYAKPLQTTGNLYKVDIPDAAIPMMLDWDKPFNQQSQAVKDAFTKLYTDKNVADSDIMKWFAGIDKDKGHMAAFYNNLATSDNLKGAKDVSRLLAQEGVTGVRYLDEGSRAAGKGTSNYVVFDPSTVKILEKNDKPIDVFSILYK